MCGNHVHNAVRHYNGRGSPPRVREPRVLCVLELIYVGITPACAGTTLKIREKTHMSQDHPRVCGNHSSQSRFLDFERGSPPRVREPPKRGRSRGARSGITPACAGTTTLVRDVYQSREDHPRVCGNHCNSMLQEVSLGGSPPRVREPLTGFITAIVPVRITPACAGTTNHGEESRSVR